MNIKIHNMFSFQQMGYTIFLATFALITAVFFFFVLAGSSNAASINYIGLSGGIGAPCPGSLSDWLGVRAYLYDATSHSSLSNNPALAFYNAVCKSDRSSGGFYYEGPDAAHNYERWGSKCGGFFGSGNGGTICVGACTLPFYIQADATNYSATPVWLENHAAGTVWNTFYNEGNANTVNYNIYLNRAACETCSWNACSGNTKICRDPWGNWCNTAACTANSYYCSGGNRWSRNTGCSGGSCYNNSDTKVQNCTANSYYCSGGNRWSRNTGCWGNACQNAADTKVQNCTANTSYCVGSDLCWTNTGCSGGALL